MAVPILAALFACYVLVTLWQFRRAVAAAEPEARLRESRRALILVSLGVPLLAALILAAW
ncbi:MAG: hypothetical protein F4Z25_05970 [Chloroflexi bacterium]|nr:hypothetical protein [Chloroflexota bacterium]MYE46444.1 hypothetical protein [Chloroflexota bacterium]